MNAGDEIGDGPDDQRHAFHAAATSSLFTLPSFLRSASAPRIEREEDRRLTQRVVRSEVEDDRRHDVGGVGRREPRLHVDPRHAHQRLTELREALAPKDHRPKTQEQPEEDERSNDRQRVPVRFHRGVVEEDRSSDQDNENEDLDNQLCDRNVGRAQEQERDGQREPDRADRDHGGQQVPRLHGDDGTYHHEDQKRVELWSDVFH